MNLQNYYVPKSCLVIAFDSRILKRQKVHIWKRGSLYKEFLLCHCMIIFYFQVSGEQILCFVYEGKIFLLQ